MVGLCRCCINRRHEFITKTTMLMMKSIIREGRKALALIVIATMILVVALHMSQAQNRWTERIEMPVEGTKVRNMTIGAASGGVLGGIAAAVIGGVGVVAMGTGVGAPAGIGLIALATGIGAGGGAVVGAATGTSVGASVLMIEKSSPAYEIWQWMLLIIISMGFYIWAILEMRSAKGRIVIVKKPNKATESPFRPL